MNKIAILGATSHIAQNLIVGFNQKQAYQLFLFARSPERVIKFQKDYSLEGTLQIYDFTNFNEFNYDIIINCVGIGDPGKLFKGLDSIFTITEKYDQLIMDYQKNVNNQALYISLSSGAAYNSSFIKPVSESSITEVLINQISTTDHYAVAKVNSEAKHRALKHYNIVDLRIFGFFSRYIDLESKFFLTQLISCLKSQTLFQTNVENISRDYVHPRDLLSLIECCIEHKKINDVYDVYSLNPVSKNQILEYFSEHHGLNYQFIEDHNTNSSTGNKLSYYSTNRRAERVGYHPKFSSMDCLIEEYNAMKL
jgi:nucleoside-diphosphate-sugar epimerase